jgi:hypothetical protein
MKLLLLTATLLGAGCRTIATHEVSSHPAPDVRVGARARTWEVRCGGELLGHVVLFQGHGHVRDSVYVVRNAWHQDLGLIDGLGRAYRYLLHEEEPAWVGSGTVAIGAQQILGAAAPCELIELDDSVPGAAPAEAPASAVELTPETAPQPSEGPLPDGGLPQSG